MEFDDLHQEIIRDHYKHPRNKKPLSHLKAFENPSCGDTVKIDLSETDHITSVYFDGSGCSISMCSASMMSELLTGKSIDDAKVIVGRFLSVIMGQEPIEILEDYGDLVALSGVINLPVRAKCATLAWNAAQQILNDYK